MRIARKPGAKINNKYVGTFGDISIWSFCNDKILNTLGKEELLLLKVLWFIKTLGVKRLWKNFSKFKKFKKKNKFKWVHDFEGTNLRMTEVQAAIGRYQQKYL